VQHSRSDRQIHDACLGGTAVPTAVLSFPAIETTRITDCKHESQVPVHGIALKGDNTELAV
jgi:hypothetical protein